MKSRLGRWSGLLLLGAWPVSGAQVLLNEIMYHAAPEMPEDTGQEWVELFNRETVAVNLHGWRLTGGIEFTFTNVTIPAQGYWVVAANVAAFNSRYSTVTNVVGDWAGTLANRGNRIELDDAAGQEVDAVTYASQGDWALRVRGPNDLGHYGWQWFTEADGFGKSLELINPDLPNQHGQNWAPSGPTYGTPGAPNSVRDVLQFLWADLEAVPAAVGVVVQLVPATDGCVRLTHEKRDFLVSQRQPERTDHFDVPLQTSQVLRRLERQLRIVFALDQVDNEQRVVQTFCAQDLEKALLGSRRQLDQRHRCTPASAYPWTLHAIRA